MKQLFLCLALFFSTYSLAADKSYYETSKGAISGYDPVAYFLQNSAVKGKKQHHYTWKNNSWYFSSADNLAAFKQAPQKYAPQYGGFCAFAAANDKLVKVDPKAWSIVDGKLYLNYSKSVRKKWKKNPTEYIEDANGYWPSLSQQVAEFN
ncbi:MAG: YHS domain-containing (seleno)protein [Pseudomonadales bacterium]